MTEYTILCKQQSGHTMRHIFKFVQEGIKDK